MVNVNRSPRLRRAMITIVVLAWSALALPLAARAQTATAGEPLADISTIISGVGVFSADAEVTTPIDPTRDGTTTSCGAAHGGAAYRIEPTVFAVIEVTVIAQGGTGSVCKVEVYDASLNGQLLESLYQAADPNRDTFLLGSADCTPDCALTAVVPGGPNYLVVWPAGGPGDTAQFDFDVQLRRRTTITSTVPSRIGDPCVPVRGTEDPRMSIWTTPDTAGGAMRFSRTFGTTTFQPLALSAPWASIRTDSWARGRHAIELEYEGDAAHAPTTRSRCADVARTTTVAIDLEDERYRWGDYGVYRDGDLVYIEAVSPARSGTVVFRMERQYASGHRYKPWRTFIVAVEDGEADLRLRAVYRSSGLPFYRVRAEFQGSRWYLPAKSRWICVQISR